MQSVDKVIMEYYLEAEKELRFSVGEQITVSLELLRGSAEIFGCKLVRNKVYTFPPYSSVSMFTWKGCKVKLRGKADDPDVYQDTLIMIPVNLHACLEEMRTIADARKINGPISLVVGPIQSGKTSFCQLLLNYAARMSRKPLYVDLDVCQNTCSIPGVISVLTVESPVAVIDVLNRQGLSVFNFGYTNPCCNIKLYYLLLKKLGQMLQSHFERADPTIRSSGVIIDTWGHVIEEGYTALTLAAYAFQIDVVFVIGDEKLYSQLKVDLPYCVQVVYLPRQEGIVERSAPLRRDIQANKLWEYFYGSITARLEPYEFEVNFCDVEIYTATQNSNKVLKNPFKIDFSDVAVTRVTIGPELVNQVLALSFAGTASEGLFVTSVKGFVCVTNVDMNTRVFSVLCPQPGPLPSNILTMGNVKLRRYGSLSARGTASYRTVDYSTDQ